MGRQVSSIGTAIDVLGMTKTACTWMVTYWGKGCSFKAVGGSAAMVRFHNHPP